MADQGVDPNIAISPDGFIAGPTLAKPVGERRTH